MGRHLPIVLIAALIPGAATATEVIPGPINARVVSVYDGDTMVVDTEPWPGLTVHTKVRLAGVDTPELRGECQAEKDMEAGDMEGEAVWLRIGKAIEELLSEERPKDAEVH